MRPMISIACRCGLRLTTDAANAGRQVACPGCGALVDFAGAATADREDAGDPVRLGPIEPEALCPGCGSHDTVAGRLRANRSPEGGISFVPEGVGWLAEIFRRKARVTIGSAGRSCLGCGLAWSSVDPEALRSCLREQGDATARARWADPAPKPSPEADLA